MIIADENLHQHFIDCLLANDYEVFLIREELSGISDYEVAAFVQYKQGIVITEDKDFGELVFAHNIRGISVVFLRYDKTDLEHVTRSLLRIVSEYSAKLITTLLRLLLAKSESASCSTLKKDQKHIIETTAQRPGSTNPAFVRLNHRTFQQSNRSQISVDLGIDTEGYGKLIGDVANHRTGKSRYRQRANMFG